MEGGEELWWERLRAQEGWEAVTGCGPGVERALLTGERFSHAGHVWSFEGAVWGPVVPPPLLPMGILRRHPSSDMMGLGVNTALGGAGRGSEAQWARLCELAPSPGRAVTSQIFTAARETYRPRRGFSPFTEGEARSKLE